MLGTRLSDHQFLRYDLLVDPRVATDVLEQQLARLNTHIIRLILDDRQFGRYVFRVNIIGKTYQRHVFFCLMAVKAANVMMSLKARMASGRFSISSSFVVASRAHS